MAGKWQKRILERANAGEPFTLETVLPKDYSRWQYQAAHRAAWALAEKGQLAAMRFLVGSGGWKLYFAAPGYHRNPRTGKLMAWSTSAECTCAQASHSSV